MPVVQIPEKLIEKAISRYAAEIRKTKQKVSEPPKKIITISRQLGTGGRKIAETLGKKLACTVWGREILDVLASQSDWNYQSRMFEALDEKTQNAIEGVIGDFFGRVDKHAYFYLLPRAVYVIAQSNAIILGRGSYLLLPNSFRVHIKASFETRVKNMTTYEGHTEKEARALLKKIDKTRDSFIKDLANRLHIKDYHNAFDLEINTDRIDVKNAAATILHGFSLYYFDLKKKKKNIYG